MNPNENIKKIRGYALAVMPFMGIFAFQVMYGLKHRPEVSDPKNGYTIAIGLDGGETVRYISALDCLLTFGPFFIASLIMLIGLWRSGVIVFKPDQRP